MIRKSPSAIPNHVHVVFELPPSVWADKVFLTGDFNDWRTDELKMRQDRDGVWRITLDLRANQRFQYRYVVDGCWQSDWHADGFEDNEHGSQNSVVDTTVDATMAPLTPDQRSRERQAPHFAPLPHLGTVRGGYHIDDSQTSSRNAA